MAMTIAYDAIATTGRKANSQMLGPNMVLYSGTWAGNSTATGVITLTSTTNVPTAVSSVLMANVWNAEAVSEAPTFGMNVDAAGADSPGSIGILAVADNVNNTGFWWAICVLGA
jgi:hypothetical protein